MSTSCHTQAGALQRARDTRGNEADVEHKLLEFFDWVISHGFKSIVTLPLVGGVGINFDACLTFTLLQKDYQQNIPHRTPPGLHAR
jgi:hypothetical protein